MMADLARIKRNVAKMVSMGAPETDIDAYIAEEGTTVEAVRAFSGGPTKITGKVTPQAEQPGPSQNVIDARPKAPVDLMTATAATINGITGSVPFLNNVTDALAGTGAQLTGGDYGQTVQGLRDRRAQIAQQAPIASVAGNVAGLMAPYGAAVKIPALAQGLGMTGSLGQRVANSALSSGAISAANAASQGENAAGSLTQGAYGAAFGGAVPLAGSAIAGTIGAIGRKAQPVVGAIMNPAKEAQRRAGSAFIRDNKANAQGVVNSADEMAAADAGVPFLNADRGGETVRALTRSVANQSPEARGFITKTADERFRGQSDRAVRFLEKLAGGNVDDIALRTGIQDLAKSTNNPAYKAAYSSPKAAAVWSPDLRQLMQSQDFLKAINMTGRTASNDAAIAGVKAVQNPFVRTPNGDWTLRKLKDGSYALPSLQFWDVVQRNLRKLREGLPPTAKQDAMQFDQLRQKLLQVLDGAVPEFQTARQGAAAFFGAESALDAGRKFATQPRMVPEAKAAFQKFNGTEQKQFAVGYASSIIDRIKSANDGQNVIRSVFENPAARELNEMVFGKAKFAELEAYVRVEQLADRLRGALGNSTTARQLVELGLGAGSGFAFTGGDWKGALTGAAAAKGVRYAGQKLDDRVMEEMAKLLMSGSRADLDKAVTNAAMSDQWMNALRALERALEVPAKAGAMAAAQ